jgi:hypothetical protein
MSHHPNKIKNPPGWQMSYGPPGILDVVELKRKDPVSIPGLSPLREPASDIKVVIH